MKPSKKKSAKSAKKAVFGKGDYAVLDLKNLNDLESRVKKIEGKPQKKNSGVGSTLGRTLGSFLGNGDIGSSIGDAAEGALAKWFGHGDYELKSNSLVSAMSGTESMPKFYNSSRGLRITEREYIGDVKASVDIASGATLFSNSSFVINPGNSATFPWLSTIASQFEQWEPNGIIFEFKSTSSTFNGSSQALGSVIMATDYDPTDPLYPNKIVMESSDYSNMTKPSESAVHGIECAVTERPLRLLNVTSSSSNSLDAKFTSMGTFQLATQGCSVAGVTLGELWVSYDITFYKKQLTNVTQSMWLDLLPALVSNSQPFGPDVPNTTSSYVYHGLQMTWSGKTLKFPPSLANGFFIVRYSAIAATSSQFSIINNLQNCTSPISVYNTAAIGLGYNTYITYINITGRNASFDFNVAYVGATGEIFVDVVKLAATSDEYFS